MIFLSTQREFLSYTRSFRFFYGYKIRYYFNFCTHKDIDFNNYRSNERNTGVSFGIDRKNQSFDQFRVYIYSDDITVYVQPNFSTDNLLAYLEIIHKKNPFCFFICVNQNQRQYKTKFYYSGVNMFESVEVLPYLKEMFNSYREALPKNKYLKLSITFLFKEKVDFSLDKLPDVLYSEIDKRDKYKFLEGLSGALSEIATIYNIPTFPHTPLDFTFKNQVIFENKLNLKEVVIKNNYQK